MVGSLAQARNAVEWSDIDSQISPMRRGQLLTNAALNAMYAGDIPLARTWARRGLNDWQDAGLQSMSSYQTAATNLANLEQLSGDPARALTLYEEIEANASPGDNAPARSAGQISMARALALMGQAARATALAESASEAFCAALGPEALDCQRIRLAVADIANWLGDSELAAKEIDLITMTDAPAIALSLTAVRGALELNRTPSKGNVAAVDEALTAVIAQGGLGVRGGTRQRLGAAERLLAAGHDALADQLIEPLLRNAPPDDAIGGIDRIWLQLWQSRKAGTLPDQSTLVDALAKKLGAQHPSVLRWTAWRAAGP